MNKYYIKRYHYLDYLYKELENTDDTDYKLFLLQKIKYFLRYQKPKTPDYIS